MPGKLVDVLLVTDDRQLCARVGRRKPPAAKLQCVAPKDLTDDVSATGRHVWLDLDSTGRAAAWDRLEGARSAAGRVYFYSRPPALAARMPAGLFIKKPCTATVLDVLWAGAVAGPAPRRPAADAADSVMLPGWLLEFQVLDLALLCRKCVRDLPARLGYQDASLYLHDPRHKLLTLAETTHSRSIDLTVPLTAVDTNLMAAVVQQGVRLRTSSASGELVSRGIRRGAPRPYPDDRCLVAPLTSEGQLWGVLNLSGRGSAHRRQAEVPLDSVLTFLGRALHHACVHAQARTEARIDGLTGLYNQRWMMETLEREIRRAQRFGTVLSVLMIDVDGLKAINDQAGHAAGDALLRHVARRISAVLRQFDGAARVGGDEFVVMLPATNYKGACQVARRLGQSIGEDAPLVEGMELPITASIGVAEWRDGWSSQQLLDAADRAMYATKAQNAVRNGRRRRTTPGSAAKTHPPGMAAAPQGHNRGRKPGAGGGLVTKSVVVRLAGADSSPPTPPMVPAPQTHVTRPTGQLVTRVYSSTKQ